MKKALISFLTIVLTICTGIQPVLAEDESVLTIEDYNNALQIAAEEYGINAWIYDSDQIGEITQEKIDEAVNNVKLFAESIEIVESDGPEVLNTNGPRRASKANRTRVGYFDIVCILGMATIKVVVNATINLETYLISSVNSRSAYQEGVSIGFSSWTTNRISTTMNYRMSGNLLAEVTGYAVFGLNGVGYSSNMTGSCVIDFTS